MALVRCEKTGHRNSATQLQFAILPDEFRHEPLDQTKFSIRLIRFIPRPDSIIQCQLWHTALPSRLAPPTSGDPSPSYTCLSYQWKDEERSDQDERKSLSFRRIQINDQPFDVRSNLWAFLNVASHRFTGRAFWIDAICIDQRNESEKAHQIQIMGEIYASATQVLLWLGRGSHEMERCISYMSENQAAPPPASAPPDRQSSEVDIRLCLNYSSLHTSHPPEYPRSTFHSNFWKSFIEICNVSYWTRAWVVEEIILAKDRVLVMGESEMPWSAFNDYWHVAPPSIQEGILESRAFQFLESVGSANGPWQPRPLRELLGKYGGQDCSDFHDRIYSILPLAVERPAFLADYGISKQELLLRTMQECGADACM